MPIDDTNAADAKMIVAAQDKAIAEAVERKIIGRDITPFLLKRISELTEGKSLKSSILFSLFL